MTSIYVFLLPHLILSSSYHEKSSVIHPPNKPISIQLFHIFILHKLYGMGFLFFRCRRSTHFWRYTCMYDNVICIFTTIKMIFLVWKNFRKFFQQFTNV
jgi:hypothetical protein